MPEASAQPNEEYSSHFPRPRKVLKDVILNTAQPAMLKNDVAATVKIEVKMAADMDQAVSAATLPYDSGKMPCPRDFRLCESVAPASSAAHHSAVPALPLALSPSSLPPAPPVVIPLTEGPTATSHRPSNQASNKLNKEVQTSPPAPPGAIITSTRSNGGKASELDDDQCCEDQKSDTSTSSSPYDNTPIGAWLEQSTILLADVKGSWKMRNAALKRLQDLCKKCTCKISSSPAERLGPSPPHCILITPIDIAAASGHAVRNDAALATDALAPLLVPLAAQLQDLRSAVVREACKAVQALAEHMGPACAPLLLLLLPTLFRQAGCGNMVIESYAGRASLASVVAAQPEGVMALCADHVRHSNNKKVRCHALAVVRAMLLLLSPEQCSERNRSDSLHHAMTVGIMDASAEVRRGARLCFRRYNDRFADLGASFQSAIDDKIRRRLLMVRKPKPGPSVVAGRG